MYTGRVTLPEREQFATANGYYQTALHELGHASGHPDRMDRDTLKDGVGHDGRRGAAYVQGWIKAFDQDPKEMYKAAADAQNISDYLTRPIREREQATAQEHGELADKYSAARSPQISHAPTPPPQAQQIHERESGISR